LRQCLCVLAVRALVGVAAALAFTWLLLLVLLIVVRPRGMNLAEARRVIPDIVRLLRDLATDPTLPSGVRRRLFVALAYLALPIDLVPDFIPVIGYADDVIVVGVVLRSVIRRAGRDAVERHWRGSPDGLALVRRLAGVR
jgi:uncharacterized membrane protein YkvA (DUF1232 family)